MRSRTLSIHPEYSLLEIRDAEPPRDREAADAAASRAGTEIAAASNEVVCICCAQRNIPVRLTVKAYARPRNVIDEWPTEGALQFEIDFPSGTVRFGDAFHRADSMALPGGAGRYAVGIHHTGREAVDRALREIYGLPDAEWNLRMEREADIERYLVVLAPSGRAGRG